MKTCTKCGCEQPLDHFSRNKRTKDGLQKQSKGCNSAYYKADAARIIARVMAATNPEAAKIKAREWYANNTDRAKATQKQWRVDNKELKAQISATWAMNNPEKARAIRVKWCRANPEYINAKTREYRARKRGSDGKHTASDVKALMTTQKCMCAVCRTDIKNAYHVDHIMPLVLGGSNDRTNIQLLCPSCNTSKGGKHPADFMQKRGFLI